MPSEVIGQSFHLRSLANHSIWGHWPTIISEVIGQSFHLMSLTNHSIWGDWPTIPSEVIGQLLYLRSLVNHSIWGHWPTIPSEVIDQPFHVRLLVPTILSEVIGQSFHLRSLANHSIWGHFFVYLNHLCHPRSLPITTNVVSFNPVHGDVYSIQHRVTKFVSHLRQVGGFLLVLRCPPPMILTAAI